MSKIGFMEIAFSSGNVRADAKEKLVNLNDMERVGNAINGISKNESGYRRLDNYMRLESTKEFMKIVKSKYLESEVFKTSKGKVNGGTWANIYIAIDFAMWLSTEFKLEVIETFVTSKILDFRILGLESNKELNLSLDKLQDRKGKDNKGIYINVSKMIKELITIKGNWDSPEATAEYQERRKNIECELINLINLQYVTTWEEVKQYFRKKDFS